jgi:hypothetical protein
MPDVNEIDCIAIKPIEDLEIVTTYYLYVHLRKTRFLRCHRGLRPKTRYWHRSHASRSRPRMDSALQDNERCRGGRYALAGCNEFSCNAEAFPERLHLHIGRKFSAPDLLQTVVHRRALRVGHGIAAGAPRFDLSRGLGKLFLVLLRPGSGLFQQFLGSWSKYSIF